MPTFPVQFIARLLGVEFRKGFVLSREDACANQKEIPQSDLYILNCAPLWPVHENKIHSSILLFLHAKYYVCTMNEDTHEPILEAEARAVRSV